ncbi:MAG TPA: DUF5677 domain-containing protein [Coleofasciculaceae cyanobacterium]|jgi:hypothetical protein
MMKEAALEKEHDQDLVSAFEELQNYFFDCLPKSFDPLEANSAYVILAHRALRITESILNLYGKSTLASEALLRALYEIVMDAWYIGADTTSERSQRFVAFYPVRWIKSQVESALHSHIRTEQTAKEYMDRIGNFVKTYNRISPKNIDPFFKKGKSIDKLIGQICQSNQALPNVLTLEDVQKFSRAIECQLKGIASAFEDEWRLHRTKDFFKESETHILKVTSFPKEVLNGYQTIAYKGGCTAVHSNIGRTELFMTANGNVDYALDRVSNKGMLWSTNALLHLLALCLQQEGWMTTQQCDQIDSYLVKFS